MSRVFSDKIDSGRVSRVAAVLEKHLGLRLSDQDLYVNVAGGIKIAEVGAELALACAIYSARTGLPLPPLTVIAGELSLTGEVRPVRRLAGRVKTSRNLGFTGFVGPMADSQDPDTALSNAKISTGEKAEKESADRENSISAKIKSVSDIKTAIKLLFS
jgi:DNA repair protein RadA/Sms